MSRPSLELLGILEGTDKSIFGHGYLGQYEVALGKYRDEPINLIEIGVFNGASLRMWETFFPRATIVGVDIHQECKRHQAGRVIVEIGSQDDPEFLASLCAKYPPTVIIDDGSHMAHHVLFTFAHMYPKLAPGGCYIAEDMEVHLGSAADDFRGPATIIPPDFFLNAARLKMAGWMAAGVSAEMQHFVHTADSITFISHAAIIHKRAPLDPNLLANAEALAEERGSALAWENVSVLATQLGVATRAEAAARRAIALDENSMRAHHMLGKVLASRGDTEGAIAALERAALISPDVPSCWFDLSQLYVANSQLARAEMCLRRCVRLGGHVPQFHRHLSEVLARQGSRENAIEEAKAAVHLAGEGPHAAEYQAWLGSLSQQ